MSHTIQTYAASAVHAPLERSHFEAGEIGPDQIEIQVSHCGICHTDLSMLDNEWGMTQYPFVPGHEVVGTVVATGEQTRGLTVGQRVGVGFIAGSCLSCHQCLSGDQHLCPSMEGTLLDRPGGFADRLRVQWTWARPLPDARDPANAAPLLCGGITVLAPLLLHNIPATARVGVIGIGGLGHLALQFANKWGCEVHAFTTSDSKETEAKQMGAHFVHNTKRDHALKEVVGSLDLLISTVNAPQDVAGLLNTLAPKGRLHVVGVVVPPLEVPVFPLLMGQKEVSSSPIGSPAAIDCMFEFCVRHSIAPVTEFFPMSQVNDAMEHLRAGKARYRIVLTNDFA